jgi:hypothetical protein
MLSMGVVNLCTNRTRYFHTRRDWSSCFLIPVSLGGDFCCFGEAASLRVERVDRGLGFNAPGVRVAHDDHVVGGSVGGDLIRVGAAQYGVVSVQFAVVSDAAQRVVFPDVEVGGLAGRRNSPRSRVRVRPVICSCGTGRCAKYVCRTSATATLSTNPAWSRAGR